MSSTSVTELEVLDLMESIGGSFASNLAKAWKKADGANRLKLKSAFADLYKQYHNMAQSRKDHGAK